MLRGTMGGLELSKLTVLWNIIDSLKRQNPVRRVRKPRLGRVVPRRRPMCAKKAPGSSWPGKLCKGTGVAGYAVRSTRGPTPSDAANAGARFNLARPKTSGS